MLQDIKVLLGISDDSKDSLINLHISAVQQKIINYCGVSILPGGLQHVVVELVIKRMNARTDGVKSITRGDTKIDYESNQGDELESYKRELARFRKVKVV